VQVGDGGGDTTAERGLYRRLGSGVALAVVEAAAEDLGAVGVGELHAGIAEGAAGPAAGLAATAA
jgi:hypothetical protein